MATTSSSTTTEVVVTQQKIGFKGEEWNEIIAEQRDAVIDAFRCDTAAALHIPVDDVFDLRVRETNFTIYCSVRHTAALTKAEVKKILTSSPYTDMWRLYFEKRRQREAAAAAAAAANGPAEPVSPDHLYTVYLRGVGWACANANFTACVVRAVQQDIKDALQKRKEDSDARELELVESEVLVVTVTRTEDGIKVVYRIPDYCTIEQCQEWKSLLGRCNYENVWREYNAVDDEHDFITTRHRICLSGEEWSRVLAVAAEEVVEAFKEDVVATVGKSRVTDVTLSGSLVVDFSISHPLARRTRDLNLSLRDGEYRRTWDIYKRLTGVAKAGTSPMPASQDAINATAAGNRPADGSISSDTDELVVTRHRLRFPGDAWTTAVTECGSAAISKAIIEDVSDALQLPRRDVAVTTIKEGSLVADLRLTHPSTLEKRRIDAVFIEFSFPATWRLFTSRHNDPATTSAPLPVCDAAAKDNVTLLNVHLDGEEWALVLANDEKTLRACFCDDLDACFASFPHTISRVAFTLGSLYGQFQLEHRSSETLSTLQRRIADCAFESTWALYESCVARKFTAMKDRSRHQLRFTGEAWSRAFNDYGEEMRKALVQDVTEQLVIPPSNVYDVHFLVGPRVFFTVKHTQDLTRRTVDERLEKGRFPCMNAVCALVQVPAAPPTRDSPQVERPAETGTAPTETVEHVCGTASVVEAAVEEDTVISRHRVCFEGPEWQTIVDRHETEVREAFITDIAECLHVTTEAVCDLSFEFGSLITAFGVAHSPQITREAVDAQLGLYQYPKTWGVYIDVTASMADDAVPLSITTSHHCVHLPGPSWDAILQGHAQEVKDAFINDVSGELHLAKKAISNIEFSRGSLIVDFDLQLPVAMTYDEADTMLGECRWTETWALYEEYDDSIFTTETQHRIRLEGDHWETVLTHQEDELRAAFIDDVCEATELPKRAVVDVCFSLGSLIIEFRLRHGDEPHQVFDQKLAGWSFPRTWAFYQSPAEGPHIVPPVTVTTSHRVRLEGNLWPQVMRYQLPALTEAFQKDVGLACSLPKENFGDFVFNEGVFRVQFTCDHSPDLSASEINEALAKSTFVNTFALYPAFAKKGTSLVSSIRKITQTEDEVVLSPEASSKAAQPTRDSNKAPPALRAEEEQDATEHLEGLKLRSLHDNGNRAPPLRREVLPLQAEESYVSLDGLSSEHITPTSESYKADSQFKSSTVHTAHHVRLKGDHWAWVLENYKDLLRNEFSKDVSNATSLPQRSVQQLTFAVGSLLADFQLEHDGAPQDKLDKLLNNYKFPLTKALHELLPVNLVPAAVTEAAQRLQRVGTPEEAHLSVQHAAEPVAARSAERQPLQASESFMSLDALDEEPPPVLQRVGTPEEQCLRSDEEQPPVLQRVGTPEEAHLSVQHAAEPVAARSAERQPLQASESFMSLDALDEEPPPVLQRVGTPEEAHLSVQHAAEPVAARSAERQPLQASESFMSLDALDEEPPALRCGGTPEEQVLRAAEEEPPVLQRVGTPEEAHLSVQHAAEPVAARSAERQPLQASESFMSLDALDEEPPVLQRVGTPEEQVLRAADEQPPVLQRVGTPEEQVLRAAEEEPPVLQRVGTPEEAHLSVQHAAEPVAARSAERQPLQASESFMSLDALDEEPPALRRGGTPEEQCLQAAEEEPPVLQRVGTPEEAHLSVQHAAEPVAARSAERQPLQASESFMSLDALDEEPPALRRVGTPEEQCLRAAEEEPPVLQRVGTPEEQVLRAAEEQPPVLQSVGTPEEQVLRAAEEEPPVLQRVGTPEEAHLSVQHAAEPVAARSAERQPLQASESFMSLDALDEEPPALRRVGTPEEQVLRAAEEEPPVLQRVGTPEEQVLRAAEEQPPVLQRVGTPEEQVLRAAEEQPPVLQRVGTPEEQVLRAAEEQPPVLQRVGTPEEQVLRAAEEQPPVLQRVGTAEERQPLQASESFMSLDALDEEPPALRRVGTPEEQCLQAAEEQPPVLQRVGTAEDARLAPSCEAAPCHCMAVAEPYHEGLSRGDVCEAEEVVPVVATEVEKPVLQRAGTAEDARLAPLCEAAPCHCMAVAEPYHEGLSRGDVCEAEEVVPVVATEVEKPVLQRAGTAEDARLAPSCEAAPCHCMAVAEPYHEGLSRGDVCEAEEVVPVVATEVEKPVLQRAGTPDEELPTEERVGALIAATEGDAEGHVIDSPSGPEPGDCDADTVAGAVLTPECLPANAATPRVTHHQIVLQGRDWYKVVQLPMLRDAFRDDCANALGVAPRDVHNVALAAGSLIGSVDIVHAADQLSMEEADVKLRNYHYPETWKFYPSSLDPEKAHLFDSESALPALRKEDSQLLSSKRELPADDRQLLVTASGRLLPRRPYSAVEYGKSTLPICNRLRSAPAVVPAVQDSLPAAEEQTVVCEKTQAEGMASEAVPMEMEVVNQEDALCPPSVDVSAVQLNERYAVVEQSILPEPAAIVHTRHRVGFVGERWPVILQNDKDAFCAAFIKGTCEKLGFGPDAVDRVRCDNNTGDTIVTFHIAHPTSISGKEIDLTLRNAPYEDIWKLYYGSVAEAGAFHTGEITSFHRVGFVGNKWRDVIDRDTDRFRNAFAADTAAALNISPQAVSIADYAVAEDIVVDFYVTHPSTESDLKIDNKLEVYDYHRVWDLYGIPNEADEGQRDVPLVMKRSPASRRSSPASTQRLWSQEMISALDLDGSCPTCRRRWSPEHPPLVPYNSHSQVRTTFSNASSNGDALRDSTKDDHLPAVRRTTPPVYQRRFQSSIPATSSGWRTPYLRSGQAETVRPPRGAETSPRAPRLLRYTGRDSNSTSSSLVPHPPRQRRLSSATRHRQRRVNLRELEGELSKKERERTYRERQEQLEREIRRSMTLSRTSLSATTPNTSISRSFLPPIPTRYTKVRPRNNGLVSNVDGTAER
ncbi:hypothetical protein NQL31_002662 [Lotmaria passim]